MSAAGAELAVAREGPVALLEIRRGPNNHVDPELLAALAGALEALDAEPEHRCAVIASEGRNFCGGADLGRPGGVGSGDPTGIGPLYEAALRLFRVRKPLVAAVQGAAVGAGLGLALACDLRVAAEGARFSANFVKLGFHPGFALTTTLPRQIGSGPAALMFLTGRRVPAPEAFRLGLVDALAPEGEVRPAALALAREIAEGAPLAVEATRATLRRGLAEAVADALAHERAEQARLMRTEDFREGVRAVAERRPGVFRGR